MQANTILSWKAPEYAYREKSKEWFIVLWIITFALIVAAYIGGNFLFGVLILLGSFTLMLYAVRKPRIVTISIINAGIKIEDRLFPFESLKSFWISERADGNNELKFDPKKSFVSNLKILIANTDPDSVRNALSEHLEEKEQDESFSDTIADLLRL